LNLRFLRLLWFRLEPTREAAMAAFAKSWRRECPVALAVRSAPLMVLSEIGQLGTQFDGFVHQSHRNSHYNGS
jgi:hypothetical protein